MTPQEAQAEIDRLAELHGLQPITLRVNNRLTRTGGLARLLKGEICMPEWMLTCSEAANTLRHEVAHYLARARHGKGITPHGREWRRAALDCGATPTPYLGEAARLAAPPARRMDRRWLGECGQGCKVTRSRLTDAVRVRRWTCLEHRLPISWQWVGTDNRG